MKFSTLFIIKKDRLSIKKDNKELERIGVWNKGYREIFTNFSFTGKDSPVECLNALSKELVDLNLNNKMIEPIITKFIQTIVKELYVEQLSELFPNVEAKNIQAELKNCYFIVMPERIAERFERYLAEKFPYAIYTKTVYGTTEPKSAMILNNRTIVHNGKAKKELAKTFSEKDVEYIKNMLAMKLTPKQISQALNCDLSKLDMLIKTHKL